MLKEEINENGLIADLFTDVSSQPRKAIIMLGGSEGGKSWSRIKRPIELLVQRGYAVLSLAYFKAQGLPNSLQKFSLEYFEKAFKWLSAQNEITSNQFAILGGSKGAEAALLLGSLYPQVKTVIAFSPSCVVWQGISEKRFEFGEDLPFLAYPTPIKKSDLLLMRLRKMHEEALRNAMSVKAATIQVENIQGAIMLVSGEQDRLWPATVMSEKISSRLKAKEFDYSYEHTEYNMGHNRIIMNKSCWRNIFEFLEKHY